MNQLKKKSSKPCENCPERFGSFVTPPLEFQWASFDQEGNTIYQAADTTEEVRFKSLDLTKIKRFVLRNDSGKEMFGIDLPHRAFMIMGANFFTDLPEGNYKIFHTRKERLYSNKKFMRWYVLGIEEVSGERGFYLYINPDQSFKIATKYI